jgi:hypothetical protein
MENKGSCSGADGVKTNVVTAAEIHERDTNDSPILPSLVETTAKNFEVAEVSADKGYSSVDNTNAIISMGGDSLHRVQDFG